MAHSRSSAGILPTNAGHLADVGSLASAEAADVVDAQIECLAREVAHLVAGDLQGIEFVGKLLQPREERGSPRCTDRPPSDFCRGGPRPEATFNPF